MTLLVGDRVASPYLRRDRDELLALLPPGIDRVSVTHGGHGYSVYLYSGDRVVGQVKGARSVKAGVVSACLRITERTPVCPECADEGKPECYLEAPRA